MTSRIPPGAPLLVVGAGIMGSGIAQVAAQAGHAVRLHDSRAGAAAAACARLAGTFDGLVAKGRLETGAAQAALARITPVATLYEAADAVLHGVCTAAGADAAMTLGVNHPAGPFEFLARWSVHEVVTLLDALDAHYRGERYRVSPWLRQRAAAAQRRD